MGRTHYYYFRLALAELDLLVKAHQERFDDLIGDTFDDDEINQIEKQLDDIAAVIVQPILEELSFDDFYVHEAQVDEQRAFFESCRSSICIDNLPYLESNPFQVTYLKQLLSQFDQVLIDQGGVSELVFKNDYLKELEKFKSMDGLILTPVPKPQKTFEAKTFVPVDPIDFLVVDVYKEIQRLKAEGKLPGFSECPFEIARKLFHVMSQESLDPASLYAKSGLVPKDFDDYLEKLKFWLKRI